MRCTGFTQAAHLATRRMASTAPLYDAAQIIVPAELPRVIKDFAKAALRSAPPGGLLAWAAACVRETARAVARRAAPRHRCCYALSAASPQVLC